jgi:hypothetical protein
MASLLPYWCQNRTDSWPVQCAHRSHCGTSSHRCARPPPIGLVLGPDIELTIYRADRTGRTGRRLLKGNTECQRQQAPTEPNPLSRGFDIWAALLHSRLHGWPVHHASGRDVRARGTVEALPHQLGVNKTSHSWPPSPARGSVFIASARRHSQDKTESQNSRLPLHSPYTEPRNNKAQPGGLG